MIKTRHIIFTTLLFCVTLLLSGCQLTMLNPKGIIAAQEKHILIFSALLMLVVVIPVCLLSYIFAWRYREGNEKATYSPNWSHNTLIEIVCWSVPCIIIAILGTITWISSHQLDPYKPLPVKDKEAITIQVIGLEWKWLFIYPEYNIASVNFVQFPVDTPVKFLITSEGPMNSFQIPQLAGQIYAMAGMQTKLHLNADTMGDYRGFSANYSGRGFSGMLFTARVSTKEQFDEWVKTVKQSNAMLSMAAYDQLVKPSENHPVQYFASAHKDIFDTAVMKSMMPMKDVENLCAQKEKVLASSEK